MAPYSEQKNLDLPAIDRHILRLWQQQDIYNQSLKIRKGAPTFVFYEGPPSANGLPGIHHVLARAIKDVICRFRTQCGFLVERKAGWDTHGLPVELGVEQKLGITKEDIGRKISIQEYNSTCRQEVMKYTDQWRRLTEQMGYWIDLDHPYITYDNKYIETLWWILRQLYDKGLLYRGKTIQPFSPAAGTGLSTHELNQPGCYRDVADTTVVALFQMVDEQAQPILTNGLSTYILAWTTTPWTLPSNTALAVASDVEYVYIETLNPYTGTPQVVILARDRLDAYFKPEGNGAPLPPPESTKQPLPWREIRAVRGKDLVGIHYAPIFPWVSPSGGDPFRVILGDFVTTSDGTGIVHIAPTFGADDARVAKQNNIPGLTIETPNDPDSPMVDRKGRFLPLDEITPTCRRTRVNEALYKAWEAKYVKRAYIPENIQQDDLDIDLCVDLKQRGLAFRIEKHTHSYPHCWRTDKPVLYYPLDSWFIRTTEVRERMLALNETINWKPQSTGSGRFAKWLENLVDWNLSRSRFWGTPLPIWTTEDRSYTRCIGSLHELKEACQDAVDAGLMAANPLQAFNPTDFSQENYDKFDLHRPAVDAIILRAPDGQPMHRTPDLVDVWFDSGAMPYAQLHYPFENKELFQSNFPAHFIAEGVDQTRGWFFTLHALSTMLFDSVAFKNIISNGLVLDRQGNKMSKRLGNAVDPFDTIAHNGADAVRWYMLTNSQPWDNLKFDPEGIEEVSRRFFATLHNTYSFFSLYANVDGYQPTHQPIPLNRRTELDRWVLSALESLKATCLDALESYEPLRAGRAIETFVCEHLSNWYVRLNRKRFWGSSLSNDKIAAYQTLEECLTAIAQLMAPLAPFYADWLYNALRPGQEYASVHLCDYPRPDSARIDSTLERKMLLAQRVCSLTLALRRKVAIKVRQPLQRILVPVDTDEMREHLLEMAPIILRETNVKLLEPLGQDNTLIQKKIKPDFKKLGPKAGPAMKALAAQLAQASQSEIAQLQRVGHLQVALPGGKAFDISTDEVEILTVDMPGWELAVDDELSVALDMTITEQLLAEGAARELINRIQNMRKEAGLQVTDRIKLLIATSQQAEAALRPHLDYIAQQTLANTITLTPESSIPHPNATVELNDSFGQALIHLLKD